MDEIFALSDRVAVLRDGELLAVEPAEVLTRQKAINLMAGRDITRRISSARACNRVRSCWRSRG